MLGLPAAAEFGLAVESLLVWHKKVCCVATVRCAIPSMSNALLASNVIVARLQQAGSSRARRVACSQSAPAPAPAHVSRGPSTRAVRGQSIVVSAARSQPVVLAAAAAPNWQVGNSKRKS